MKKIIKLQLIILKELYKRLDKLKRMCYNIHKQKRSDV